MPGLLLKERLTLKKALSVCLAMMGVSLIVGIGEVDLSSKLGGIALLSADLTWALMSVFVKRLPSDYSQIVIITYSISVALIVLTPFVLPRLPEINVSQLTHPTIWGGLL